ncbi:MAG: pseudouridine synthase [Fusicatenibacter sp.]|nr:rRNA pseudouridine synthase [Fusicatenibacter sp.]
MSRLRLDKYLADMGKGTRTQVKGMIRSGRVTVNGQVIKTAEWKVDTEQDAILLDDQPIRYETMEYWMLHKPSGVVSATTDAKEKTVLDLLPDAVRKDLFPVGRLDKDTEGLLLITNDGALAHRLLSPRSHVDKMYYAKIQGKVTQADAELFARGVDIGDEKPTLPAKLEIRKSDQLSEILITIQEGRYHQIKRMFEAAGKQVIYLKRLSMGPLVLDEQLKAGEARRLTGEERNQLCHFYQ